MGHLCTPPPRCRAFTRFRSRNRAEGREEFAAHAVFIAVEIDHITEGAAIVHVHHILTRRTDGLDGALLEGLHLRQEGGEIELALQDHPGPQRLLSPRVQPVDPPLGTGNTRLDCQRPFGCCLDRHRIIGHIVEV